MEEDDDFGDLYAGLGETNEADGSAAAAQPASTLRFSLEEEDEDDDDYAGFGGAASTAPPPQPTSVRQNTSMAKGSTGKGGSGQSGDLSEDEPGSDSDSDDDLQIVLNNDKRGVVPETDAVAGGDGNEEAEDVPATGAASQPWVDEQASVQMDQAPVPQQPLGVVPGTLPPGLMAGDQPKQNLLNVGAPPRPPGKFMHHAQFKYMRAPTAMGPPGANMPGIGRGTYPPGPWGPGKGPPQLGSGPPRPWSGSGGYPHTEFHLPPTKTVFDMDLDALDDKPWRNPNADMTDYFNFGFNENSWRQYCQQLSQLRLEATMQSKISVYESGRSEQPIGRAIQVEGGVGERRPSYDIRRGRNRDSSDIIEIVLKDVEVETPVPFIDRMDMGESDYDMGHEQDGPDPRAGPLLGRNPPYMDADVPPFFPIGRPRGPYHRMFPGNFNGRGGVMRPPFYEPGIPPLPMHMRPEGFAVGNSNDYEARRASNRSSQGRGPGATGLDEEHSSGSVALKDDRKHADSRDDRRSRGSRDQGKDDEEQSDEHKKSASDDKYDHGRRYADSRSQKDRRKEDVERSSYSDDEEHKKHRSRKEGNGDADRHPSQMKVPASDERERRSDREKDQRKEDEWSRRSYREREDPRWKEEEARRSRGKDEDVPRSSRREDDGRKRDKHDEYYQRKDRDESWKRDRDRDDSQKRRPGYDDVYDRRDREDDRYSDRSRRHVYEEEDDYLRRKSKHSERKDYRHEDEHYDHRGSSRSGREHSDDRYKEEERVYRDKFGWSSRGREDSSSRRNGSTTDYLEEKDRKKRKTDEYQKGVHAEKVQGREVDDETSAAAAYEKKKSSGTYHSSREIDDEPSAVTAYEKKKLSGTYHSSRDIDDDASAVAAYDRKKMYHSGRGDDSYSSGGDEETKHRKGRSKLERLNRERPATNDEDEKPGKAGSAKQQQRRQQQEQGKGSSSAAVAAAPAAAAMQLAANGAGKQELDPFAKRRERFQSQKGDGSADKKKASEKVAIQPDTTEFKHERPARKRRWGS